MLGAASGAVAGLATVTQAVGFIGRFSVIIIGGFAWILCYFAVVWKGRIGYDDPLDVVGIHGMGGVFGIPATGLLASKAINAVHKRIMTQLTKRSCRRFEGRCTVSAFG